MAWFLTEYLSSTQKSGYREKVNVRVGMVAVNTSGETETQSDMSGKTWCYGCLCLGLTKQRDFISHLNTWKHSPWLTSCHQGIVFFCALSKCAHPSKSEGPDHILCQGLHLYTSHLEVTINFCVVRPIFVTLDLNKKWGTTLHPRKIKPWRYVTARTTLHHTFRKWPQTHVTCHS